MLHAQICEKCFLVQVDPNIGPSNFFEEYSYQSGLSNTWKKHCDQLAKKIKKLRYKKNTIILEVASNDGTQLDFLRKNNFLNIYGVDPSKNLARNNKKMTTGIFTDGDIKRVIQKNNEILKRKIKIFMTKNPISIEKDTLAVKALNIMNEKKNYLFMRIQKK